MAATGAEPISAENIKEALEALLASDALSDAIMGVVADYEASRTYWTGSVTIKNDYNGSYFWPSITTSGVSAFGIEMDKVSVGHEARWGLACFELEVGKSYMVEAHMTDEKYTYTGKDGKEASLFSFDTRFLQRKEPHAGSRKEL